MSVDKGTVEFIQGTPASYTDHVPTIVSGAFTYMPEGTTTNQVAYVEEGWRFRDISTQIDYVYDAETAVWIETIGIRKSFETVSKNLREFPCSFAYTAEQLTSITYDKGDGKTIVKTLNYNSEGVVTSVVLSGDIDDTISTTKTLTYNSEGLLTNITYS